MPQTRKPPKRRIRNVSSRSRNSDVDNLRTVISAIRGCELRRLPTLLVGGESLKYNHGFG